MPPEAQHRLVDCGSDSSAYLPAVRAFPGSGERDDVRIEILGRGAPTLGSSGLAQARARNLASWLQSSSGSASFSYDVTFAHAVLPEPVTVLVAAPDATPAEEPEQPSPLMLQRIATLRAAIEAEPVEDGTSHPAERVIAETMADNEAEGLVTAVLEVTPNSLQASILRLLGREPVRDASLRRRVIEAGLSSSDVQIRDAAVQAVESWEDADCVDLLRHHEEPVKWLADYVKDVITDLED
jgi:hypothetical protein